ncbi:MAG: hypothetical protein AAF499_15485, partial [Pseudomonadota bacterium]
MAMPSSVVRYVVAAALVALLAACDGTGGVNRTIINGSDPAPEALYDSVCGADCDLPGVSHLAPVAVQPRLAPVIGDPWIDANFGSRIQRMSGTIQVPGATRVRHFYAKSQPFNADNSFYLVWDSSGQYWLGESDTAQLRQSVPARFTNAEFFWHPTDPNRLYILDATPESDGPRALFVYRVDTDSRELIRDFSEYRSANTRGEGNMDAAGDVLVLLGRRADDSLELLRYQISTDRITARTPINASETGDWVSVSPSGRYAVTMGNHFSSVFDAELNRVHQFPTGSFGHADLCTRGDGREMLLVDGADLSGASARPLMGAALPNGRLEVFGRISWNVTPHVSCRHLDRPGWALIS